MPPADANPGTISLLETFLYIEPHRMRLPRLFIIGLSALLLNGCIKQIAISSLGDIMDDGFAVLNEEQDLDIADKSIASNLKLLESILKSDPTNKHYLLLASEGYASYALGFVEDESPDRAKVLYLRGKEFGMSILRQNKEFRNVEVGDIQSFRKGLESFSRDDVPAVFWTAIGWGSYVQWSLTDPAALADLPKIEAMMQFVLSRDSTYFYGGAQFFLGTLYGSRAKILGGDPDRSKLYFERCLKINDGKFLMSYVYYARSYAVQTQDKELFERCLSTVDSTSLEILPKARLSNAIAKKKASLLRSKIDQYF